MQLPAFVLCPLLLLNSFFVGLIFFDYFGPCSFALLAIRCCSWWQQVWSSSVRLVLNSICSFPRVLFIISLVPLLHVWTFIPFGLRCCAA